MESNLCVSMRVHVSVHLRCGACGGQRASSGVGPHVPLCSDSVSLVVCHFAHTVIWHSSSHELPRVCLPSLPRTAGTADASPRDLDFCVFWGPEFRCQSCTASILSTRLCPQHKTIHFKFPIVLGGWWCTPIICSGGRGKPL